MVGLGVMGRNLLLNMADDGFSVAGYDKDRAKVEALRRDSKERGVRGAADIMNIVAPFSFQSPALNLSSRLVHQAGMRPSGDAAKKSNASVTTGKEG
jgi:6-phosphogluconate dehydrogenase